MVARWPSGLLLLGKHKGSKSTLHCFVKWTVDGFFFFFFITPDPISKHNICFNSGDERGAEPCSGVGAPGSITHGVVPPRSDQCPEVLLAVE